MEDIFLGEPSPLVKAWIIDHYGQYALPETRVTFADGAISSYNWSGELSYETIQDEESIGWDDDAETWIRSPKAINIGTNVTAIGEDIFIDCTLLTSITIPLTLGHSMDAVD